MTKKKVDPSTLFSDSVSLQTKAFNDLQSQVERAQVDARQARNERDRALKASQDSEKKYRECKAQLEEAELTIKGHIENFASLQRETNELKDQVTNWQEHFLRVEQERRSLAKRMDELLVEHRKIPSVTAQASASKPTTPSSTRYNVPQLPAYDLAGLANISLETNSSRNLHPPPKNPRSAGRSVKRKVPTQSELPPYTQITHTPQTAKASGASPNTTTRSDRKPTVTSAARTKKVAPPPAPIDKSEEPKQLLIRRVHAVVEVKQEESDEDTIEPSLELPEETFKIRRPRNARRNQRIEDDIDYVPENVSSEPGLDENAEDDELTIGPGDDLSFDVNSSSSTRQPSISKIPPNKKRKLNTSGSTKPKTRRKT